MTCHFDCSSLESLIPALDFGVANPSSGMRKGSTRGR